jgi:hypothetical protein
MSRGNIYEHIRLLDAAGRPIELPFLEIDEELWNPAMTRLTLFIDPGRIKRGVLPLEEVGPALEAGKEYALKIESGWKDGAGQPLARSFEKRFRVTAPDREPLDPASWRTHPPAAQTMAPLHIEFGEPIDHALALRLIRITDAAGAAVAGEAALASAERHWHFTPADPWRAGSYHIVVGRTLEDLAGNNVGKPFEVDTAEPVERPSSSKPVTLSFAVK